MLRHNGPISKRGPLNADAGCVRGVEDNIRLDAARIRMVRRGMLVAAGLGLLSPYLPRNVDEVIWFEVRSRKCYKYSLFLPFRFTALGIQYENPWRPR